ncbi:MAG: dipicolinate synthase subunit DpsA [Clostridiales bacterium]|nr:dipicolinate synthase subunit DpsA [Clostridiales bacterium]
MMGRRRFAVIGGDMRLVRLAGMLAELGHEVILYACEKAPQPNNTTMAKTLREAAAGADCAVLPLPLSAKEGVLNAPFSQKEFTLEEIFAGLEVVPLVCAGRVGAADWELAARLNVRLIDYYEREELLVTNAELTAEAAVMLLLQETPGALCGERVLVIGFGRIGKLISLRLRAMGARVTSSARKPEDFAWMRALGLEVLDTRQLKGRLGGFGVIVNTAPAQILTEELLASLDPECLVLDLASKPGGVDFAAAAMLGVRAIWALSLPGETAPEAAGAAIRDAVLGIMEKREA